MCCVLFSEQTAIVYLNIKMLVFVMKKQFVLCEVQTEAIYVI